jgi:hypothetical protein
MRAPGVAVLIMLVAGCGKDDDAATVKPVKRAQVADAGAAPADAAPLPPHWTAPDLATAIGKLVGPEVRVVAFGELHARVDRAADVQSALARFDADVLPVIAARTSDLVVETWLLDPKCGKQAETATAQVETAMQRPAATKSELGTMVEHARAAKIQPHAMKLSCDDWQKVAPPGAEVDYATLLSFITRELGRIASEAVAFRDKKNDPRRLVAVYGGAMHNDRFPKDGLAEWSFAAAVDQATGGKLVEIDLYVPEFAAVDKFVEGEAWLPLLDRATPDQVIVVERGERSYLVVLPAGKIAQPPR